MARLQHFTGLSDSALMGGIFEFGEAIGLHALELLDRHN